MIPYQEENKLDKIILVSSMDNYCEPADLYCLKEQYTFNASFYINSEMVSFNKIASIVAIPTLSMNGDPAPLSLLDNKMTLTITTTNINGVKYTSKCQRNTSVTDAISFDFMVPEHRTYILYATHIITDYAFYLCIH